VTPADRAGVRGFLARFDGQELEVGLEATTGWRFVVEELHALGARVHLAEPAETATLRETKKRAKSDRADARHLRELVMVDRLPESWIPPEHILDLRARVRLRHTLSEQRGEWQQRIQSVLYHHGCPQRGDLINRGGLEWLAAQRRCSRPRNEPADAPRQTTSTTSKPQNASVATEPASRSHANCSSAATTPCASSARTPSHQHDHLGARETLIHPDAPRPVPGRLLPPPRGGRPA
jgi:hypothetical protein